MIPKTIHYCWFGRGKMPQLVLKCIASWKKYLPDYTIKEWNEDNFDVNMTPYTAQAYAAKKYAFVSDYARFWILYHHGGLYFDTDVEIVKPLDEIIERGPFMGVETPCGEDERYPQVAPGLGLGVEPGNAFYKQAMELYESINFLLPGGKQNTTTVVCHITGLLVGEGLQPSNALQQVAGIWIYPRDYFCPLEYGKKHAHFTHNTVAIHHFAGSWLPLIERFRRDHPTLMKWVHKTRLALMGQKE